MFSTLLRTTIKALSAFLSMIAIVAAGMASRGLSFSWGETPLIERDLQDAFVLTARADHSTGGGGCGGSQSGDNDNDNDNGSVGDSSSPDAGGSGGCTGGSCCFVAGTQVSMADGSTKNIEEVVSGDRVLSYDEETQTMRTSTVAGTISPVREGVFVVNHGLIKVTGDHPLYIERHDAEGRMWASFAPDMTLASPSYQHLGRIPQITVGDRFIGKTGTPDIVVEHISYEAGDVQTYSLVRSEWKNYIANGVVAHNCW